MLYHFRNQGRTRSQWLGSGKPLHSNVSGTFENTRTYYYQHNIPSYSFADRLQAKLSSLARCVHEDNGDPYCSCFDFWPITSFWPYQKYSILHSSTFAYRTQIYTGIGKTGPPDFSLIRIASFSSSPSKIRICRAVTRESLDCRFCPRFCPASRAQSGCRRSVGLTWPCSWTCLQTAKTG